MKKILSILSAITLSTTVPLTVVSCANETKETSEMNLKNEKIIYFTNRTISYQANDLKEIINNNRIYYSLNIEEKENGWGKTYEHYIYSLKGFYTIVIKEKKFNIKFNVKIENKDEEESYEKKEEIISFFKKQMLETQKIFKTKIAGNYNFKKYDPIKWDIESFDYNLKMKSGVVLFEDWNLYPFK